MSLKIAVCVKSVPDPDYYDKTIIDPITKSLVREGVPSVINQADKHALELALTMKEKSGGEVTAVSMGPPDARETLYESLAMGADKAVLLSGKKFAGADTLATSYALSVMLKSLGHFDIILAGNESDDGGAAHVPSQLGEWLGLPHIVDIIHVDFEDEQHLYAHKKMENGTAIYKLSMPCVIAVKKEINTARETTLWGLFEAESKPLIVSNGDGINDLDETCLGMKGSPTQPGELIDSDRKRNGQIIEGNAESVASDILAKINALTGAF